jgi:hypothetical protein
MLAAMASAFIARGRSVSPDRMLARCLARVSPEAAPVSADRVLARCVARVSPEAATVSADRCWRGAWHGSARGYDSLESAMALWCLLWEPWRVHCLNAVLQPWPATLVHCLNAVLEFRTEPQTANISPCRMA